MFIRALDRRGIAHLALGARRTRVRRVSAFQSPRVLMSFAPVIAARGFLFARFAPLVPRRAGVASVGAHIVAERVLAPAISIAPSAGGIILAVFQVLAAL